jgi:four helix bundle protein
MNPKTQELLDRTFKYGVRILKFLRTLPDDYISRIPKGQEARAALSIGANYEESQGAITKREFANKISICYREARESVYFLRVLKDLFPEEKYKKDFQELINERTELKKIFSSIKKSSIENPNR